jgi:phage FluMu protein Com/uncharacterized membrane protein
VADTFYLFTRHIRRDKTMPIEFRCTKCAKLLRTGDDTAGKQAKCPACQAIVAVPTPEQPSPEQPMPPQAPQGSSPFGQAADETPQSPFGDGYAASDPPMDSDNPYQAPPEYATPPSYYAAAGGGEIRPTQIDFSETFSRTWASFTDQLGMCILVAFLCWIMNMVAGQTINMANFAMAGGGVNEVVMILVVLPLWCAVQLFSIWIGIGQAMFFLKVARGQEAPVSDIFAGGPYLLRILGASILLVLGGLLIIAVCCLPGGAVAGIGALTHSEELTMVGAIVAGIGALVGYVGFIVVMMMFFQFYYLIVDRNMGIMEALSASREIMAGNKGTAFGVLLVAGILGGLFGLFTCFIGFFAVIPYMCILYAVLYLSCTGQPTMSDIRDMQYQPPQ